jgi:NDP-sugar pyrophosphorylase family protein
VYVQSERRSTGGHRLVILAGGLSSRMASTASQFGAPDPATSEQIARGGKTMVGVDPSGRPLISYLAWNASSAGYAHIVLLLGARNAALRTYIEERSAAGEFPGIRWTFASQPIPAGRTKPLGTADALEHALRAAPEWTGHAFTVCNGDNLYSQRAFRLLAECASPHALIDYDRDALQFDEERIRSFAVLVKDEEGFLQAIIEKPGERELARARDAHGRIGVSMNIFRFTYDRILPVLERLPLHPVRGEKELPSAVLALLQDDLRAVRAVPLAEHVPDLTAVHDIAVLRSLFAAERGGAPSC